MGNKSSYIEENYPTFKPDEEPTTREEKIVKIFEGYQPSKIQEFRKKFKFQKSRIKYENIETFVKQKDTFSQVNKFSPYNCIDYMNQDLQTYQTETEKILSEVKGVIYDFQNSDKVIEEKKEFNEQLDRLTREFEKKAVIEKAKEYDPDNAGDSDEEIENEVIGEQEEDKEELNDWNFDEKFYFELAKYTNTYEQVK